MSQYESIPQELRAIPQWVGWKYLPPLKPGGKRRKVPMNPHNGKPAKVSAPGTWGDFAAAVGAVARWKGLEGVGFVFTAETGLAGVDFDECIVNGRMTPEAAALVGALNSYTEISPSGTGVKVILRGSKPAGLTGCKVPAPGCSHVEVYDHGRFFTVTGRRVADYSAGVECRQAEISALCEQLWPGCAGEKQQAEHKSAAGVSQCGGGRVERCRKYLAEIPDSVEGQNGSGALLRAACECFRFGLGDDEAWDVLNWFNATKCEPKWSAKELRHKLDNARAKVEAKGEVGQRLRETRPVGAGPNQLPTWYFNTGGLKLKTHDLSILRAIADWSQWRRIDAAGSIGCASVGYDRLAKLTGMCKRTCHTHVKAMIAAGLLVVVKRGGILASGELAAITYAIPGTFGALDRMKAKGKRPQRFDGSVQDLHPVPTGLLRGQDLHPVQTEVKNGQEPGE